MDTSGTAYSWNLTTVPRILHAFIKTNQVSENFCWNSVSQTEGFYNYQWFYPFRNQMEAQTYFQGDNQSLLADV